MNAYQETIFIMNLELAQIKSTLQEKECSLNDLKIKLQHSINDREKELVTSQIHNIKIEIETLMIQHGNLEMRIAALRLQN